MQQNTPDDSGSPLIDLIERHPALAFILAWLESNEDWVLLDEETSATLSPLIELMNEPPPKMDGKDALLAALIMNAIKASPTLLIIDWIDQNKDNDIGAMFLAEDADLPPSFQYRLKHILTALLRGELLTLFFTKEHLLWIQNYLK